MVVLAGSFLHNGRNARGADGGRHSEYPQPLQPRPADGYRDRDFTASIYDKADDELVAVEPIPMERLTELVEQVRT
jgi:hypothetical protein